MAVDLLLSTLISTLVKKVGESLIEQFCRMRDMEDDRKKLQRHLLAIQEKILHAEEHEANIPCVRAWLKELRAVAFEALDVLDDFHHEAFQQQSSVFNKVKNLLSVENPILFRLSLSKSKRVASMVETIPSNHLKPLNEEDSWQLFQKRAFKDGMEGLPELVEIGRTIVCNCGGSPRALKAIGTLLSSKREVGEWRAITENCWDDEVSTNEISLEIPAVDEFNSSLSLKLLRHQTSKQVTKRKRSYNSTTANFILNNSIYKWQRCNGFDSSEPYSPSSLHPDLDTILFRLSLSDPEAQHSAAGAIRHFTRRNIRSGVVIAQAGVVPLLNKLLSSPDLHIQEHAVTALLNLSICHENKARMVDSGSTTLIVHTLKTGNTEAKENAAATLFSLTVIDEYKKLIGEAWAIPTLILLLNEGRLQGKTDAITALTNLFLYHGNKGRAVRAGLIPVLMCLLIDHDEQLTNDAVVLMAILASHREGREAIRMAEAVPALVEIVKSGSLRNRENATAVLLMLCRGKGGEMYIHEAAQCGLLVPIRNLMQTGTFSGKRQAFLLKDLIIRYSCSGLEPDMVDEAGELTDEKMVATLTRHPEGTVSTGTAEAEPAVFLIVKSGCPSNRENAVALSLTFRTREGRNPFIPPTVKCVLLYSVSDLSDNSTDGGKEKAILLEQLMIRYFLASLNLAD